MTIYTKQYDPRGTLLDALTRDIAIDLLVNVYKVTPKHNPDIYGVDLLVYKDNNLKGYVEVEVRKANYWNGTKFKFKSLHVPARKYKVLAKPKTLLMTFKMGCKTCLVFSGSKVIDSPKCVIESRIGGTESFF